MHFKNRNFKYIFGIILIKHNFCLLFLNHGFLSLNSLVLSFFFSVNQVLGLFLCHLFINNVELYLIM